MQPNILLQKMNSLNYEVESCIICDEMVDGDMGGILCLGKMYAGIFVEAHEKLKRIIIINGTYKEVKEPDVITEWNKFEKIKLIMIVNGKEGIVHFSFSINCENNFKIKKEYQIRRGSWVGIKDGLCAINKKSQEGIIKVDYYNKI